MPKTATSSSKSKKAPSGANEHFVYGNLEAYIVHLHKAMNELISKVA